DRRHTAIESSREHPRDQCDDAGHDDEGDKGHVQLLLRTAHADQTLHHPRGPGGARGVSKRTRTEDDEIWTGIEALLDGPPLLDGGGGHPLDRRPLGWREVRLRP